eukprot:768518-Hanusia_phi.AAC.5
MNGQHISRLASLQPKVSSSHVLLPGALTSLGCRAERIDSWWLEQEGEGPQVCGSAVRLAGP